MSRRRDKKHLHLESIKPTGNRRSVGVSYCPTRGKVNIRFICPIEQSDFNPDGSIKTYVFSFRHKGQKVTEVNLNETTARALRDILDVVLLNLDSQPSAS